MRNGLLRRNARVRHRRRGVRNGYGDGLRDGLGGHGDDLRALNRFRRSLFR